MVAYLPLFCSGFDLKLYKKAVDNTMNAIDNEAIKILFFINLIFECLGYTRFQKMGSIEFPFY